MKVLVGGGALSIYPEGARGRGDVARTKGGAAYLALVTGAPVVPVACLGTRLDGASLESKPPYGSRFDLVIGEACASTPYPGQGPRTGRRRAVEIQRALAAHVLSGMRADRTDAARPRADGDPGTRVQHSRRAHPNPAHLNRALPLTRTRTHDDRRRGHSTRGGAAQPASPDSSTIIAQGPVPVLAVVGRPNVGKSTLVNRIIGRREAVVAGRPRGDARPGVVRRRWNGRQFTVVDTGGWAPDADGLAAQIAAAGGAGGRRSRMRSCSSSTHRRHPRHRRGRGPGAPAIRQAGRPGGQQGRRPARRSRGCRLWNLGLGEPYPVSALHGRGSGDLLDAILDALPEAPREVFDAPRGPRRVAIVGKPNVGKSSLLNRLAGESAGRGRLCCRYDGRPR